MLATTRLSAQTTWVDDGTTDGTTGVTWTYTVNGGNATITNGYKTISGDLTGTINIPRSVKNGASTYTVTALGNHIGTGSVVNDTYFNCSELILPRTVTTIGNYVFVGTEAKPNTTLHSVTYAGSSTLNFPPGTVVGTYAFAYCEALSMALESTGNLTLIGNHAFYHCQKLTVNGDLDLTGLNVNVTYTPITTNTYTTSITGIGINNGTFGYCLALKGKLILPAATAFIGQNAFHSAPLTWPEATIDLSVFPNLKIIDGGAFEVCTMLSGQLTLPSNIQAIGLNAFHGCTGLSGKLTIPGTLNEIGSSAFNGCTGLSSLIISEGVTRIDGRDIKNGNSTIASYSHGAFMGCGFTGPLVIPSTVTHIEAQAFRDCPGITGDVVVPTGVADVDAQVFMNDTGIRSITYQSPNLSFVNNAGSMIDMGTFNGCGGLEYIDMSGAMLGIAPATFDRTVNSTTGTVSYTFQGTPAHTVVYLPEGVSDNLIPTMNNENLVRLDAVGTAQCTLFYVQDGCDYFLPYGFHAANATWGQSGSTTLTTPTTAHTFTANIATAYLPYPFQVKDNTKLKGYTLSYKNNHKDEPTDNTFVFTQQETDYTYAANTPYVMKAAGATADASAITPYLTAGAIVIPATPINSIENPHTYTGAPTPNAIENPAQGTLIYPNAFGPVEDPTYDSTGTTWGFFGTTEAIGTATTEEWDAYVLSENVFHLANGGVGASRAFIARLSGSAAASKPSVTFKDIEGSTTGISSIDIDDEINQRRMETSIYTIGGQYVGKELNVLPKGIYVVNGRKVMK